MNFTQRRINFKLFTSLINNKGNMSGHINCRDRMNNFRVRNAHSTRQKGISGAKGLK